MALTSAGDLLVNMAEFQNETIPEALLHAAKAAGLIVFVGMVVPEGFERRLLRDVGDAARDIAGRLGPAVVRSKRRRG
jgi:hypothetical protein